MSAPQQPIELGTLPPRAESPADVPVIEFGGGRSPRLPFSSWSLRSWLDDHRTVPILAALSGVAAVASLVAEWQVTKVDPAALDIEQPVGRLLTADLTDLGALGGGYVVGLLALTTAIVLTLWGPVAARRPVRLAGLGIAAANLAVLAGLAASLGRQSRAIPSLFAIEFSEKQLQISYGRGIWCAAAAVLLAGAALLLSLRAHPTAVVPRQSDPLDLSVSDDSGREGISG